MSAQVTLAFLLSSAKLAQALRLMSLAEKKLDRPEEAEQTLVEAMQVFKAPQMKTCLETLYAEADSALESGKALQFASALTSRDRLLDLCAISDNRRR